MKELQSHAVVRWPSLSYAALPLIIMLITVTIIVIGYGLANINAEQSRKRAINLTLTGHSLRVDNVFDSYAHLLWGSTGKLETTGSDENSWADFIRAFNLTENFTGIESLGLTRGVSPDEQYIVYASPRTATTDQYIGVNIGQIGVLRESLDQAAKDDKTKMSMVVPYLISTKDNVKDKRTGFLLFAPYYEHTLPETANAQERMQNLRGYTIALFRGDTFFASAYKNTNMAHTKVAVYLGEVKPSNLVYTGGDTTSNDVRVATQTSEYYGRKLTFVYTFDSAYILSWWLTYSPQIIVVLGLFIGMIFAGVSGYLLRSRYRVLTYEKERDVNFAKDELLSLASHQLRTPATGVKQYLGMVLQGFAGEVPEKQRTYIERAYASNNRQLHVINDILHLAKLETGRIVLAERKFDIAKMLREVVDEQRDQAERGEVTIHLKTPSQGWIVGDSHMLWMVVENLVSNAIKYTPPKGQVVIRLARRSNRWVLTVKDTGVGIDKKDFSRLFKQFSRINNERSDFVTGTGVGLYLAHHLTILHGGSITVTSTKGKGSTFTVRLPRKM